MDREDSVIPETLMLAIDKRAYLDQNTLEIASRIIRVDDLKEVLEHYFNQEDRVY